MKLTLRQKIIVGIVIGLFILGVSLIIYFTTKKSTCTPNCTGKNCGDDDGCEGKCKDKCPGYRCEKNVCTEGDPCKDNEKDCYSDSNCDKKCSSSNYGYKCNNNNLCIKSQCTPSSDNDCYNENTCNNNCNPPGYRCGDNGCTEGKSCRDKEQDCYNENTCGGKCPGYRCGDNGCKKGDPCTDNEKDCYNDSNCDQKCQKNISCLDLGKWPTNSWIETNEPQATTSTEDNIDDCYNKCISNPKCKTFTYKLGTGLCSYYNANAKDSMGNTSDQSNGIVGYVDTVGNINTCKKSYYIQTTFLGNTYYLSYAKWNDNTYYNAVWDQRKGSASPIYIDEGQRFYTSIYEPASKEYVKSYLAYAYGDNGDGWNLSDCRDYLWWVDIKDQAAYNQIFTYNITYSGNMGYLNITNYTTTKKSCETSITVYISWSSGPSEYPLDENRYYAVLQPTKNSQVPFKLLPTT